MAVSPADATITMTKGVNVEESEQRVKLEAWHDVARWIAYVAEEFVPDQATRSYLEHVAVCVRDEGERRHARRAGFRPSLSV